jgi:alpha-ribazole phosphatase
MDLMNTNQIHLIRHAEPAVSGVLLGRIDVPLLAPPSASKLVVASVFSSPLRRAYDTAAALFPDQPVTIVEDLAEVSLGEWDGLAWADIERRDPKLAAKKLDNWFGVTPPGGEDYTALQGRAAAALRTIDAARRPTAVVAHLGINAVLWHLLTGCPVAEFQQKYLEVKTIERTN